MAEVILETPFGRVALRCPAGTAGAVETVPVELASGLTVEHCLRGVLHLALGTGEVAELSLTCGLATATIADPAAGDMLDAWTVEGPGLAGAFAMRDGEWLAGRYGLRQTGFSASSPGETLFLRAERPVVATIPFAAAWVLDPRTEEDAFAPVFAVEQALPFQGLGS